MSKEEARAAAFDLMVDEQEDAFLLAVVHSHGAIVMAATCGFLRRQIIHLIDSKEASTGMLQGASMILHSLADLVDGKIAEEGKGSN